MAKKKSSGTTKTDSQAVSAVELPKKDITATDSSEKEAGSGKKDTAANPGENNTTSSATAEAKDASETASKAASSVASKAGSKAASDKTPVLNSKPENIEHNRSAPIKPQSPANKKSATAFFALFLVLIVAAASGAAGYYFWLEQQKHGKQQLRHQAMLEQQAQALASLQSQLQKMSVSSDNNALLAGTNSQQLQQLSEQIKQTEAISQQAIEVVKRTQRGWALAEVDYLLRMAHRRIEVAKDISGAIAALKGADSRLAQLGDLSLFKIRKQLAKDISNLNTIYQADVNGVSLAIDQMIMNLAVLPFKSAEDEVKEQISKNESEQETTDNTAATEEQSILDYVYEAVVELGDIKIHAHEIEAASSAQQKYQIEQVLRTYLLSARLAVLQFDQAQFLHETGRAKEILQRHYDETDNRVQQLIKTLEEYSQLQLSPDLPELTVAWAMLQKKIKNQVNEPQIEESVKKPTKRPEQSVAKLPSKPAEKAAGKSSGKTPVKVQITEETKK